jgi:hypothetical protein
LRELGGEAARRQSRRRGLGESFERRHRQAA